MTTAYTPVGTNATATIPLADDGEAASATVLSPPHQRMADLYYSTQRGYGTQAMADANQTPTSAIYLHAVIKTTGVNGADRDLILPTLTATSGRAWTIHNACTGGHNLVVKCAAGATVNVADGKAAMVFVDDTGVWRMTADVSF